MRQVCCPILLVVDIKPHILNAKKKNTSNNEGKKIVTSHIRILPAPQMVIQYDEKALKRK